MGGYPRTPHSVDPNTKIKLKMCCRCEKWLPFEKFWKNKATWDGLVSWCKACSGKPTRLPYIVKRDVAREDNTKMCCTCSLTKSTSEFTVNRQYVDGLDRRCKNCKAEYKRGRRRQGLGDSA